MIDATWSARSCGLAAHDQRSRSSDLRRRERRAAAVPVHPAERPRKRRARIAQRRGGRGDGAEDIRSRRGEGDVGAGARERGPATLTRRRADREAASADAVRADRLEQGRRIFDRVPALVAVADRRDEKGSLRDCVVDRALLDRGRRRAAEAEIDDLRAVIDRVDDRGGFVDVREGAARTARLHDHQPRLAADACDPVPVRRRTCGEGGDEGAVAVGVLHVRLPLADVVGPRRLRAEIGSAEIGAGVDHRDRETRRRLDHRGGHLIRSHRRVLPLEGQSRGERSKGGLDERPPIRRPLDAHDPLLRADPLGEALDAAARTHSSHVQRREAPHELRRMPLERGCQRVLALIRDHGGAARPGGRGTRVACAQGGAGEREDRRHGEAQQFDKPHPDLPDLKGFIESARMMGDFRAI